MKVNLKHYIYIKCCCTFVPFCYTLTFKIDYFLFYFNFFNMPLPGDLFLVNKGTIITGKLKSTEKAMLIQSIEII